MVGIIDEIISAGSLPRDPSELLEFLTNPNGTFISQEGVNWDFKSEWPKSHSDAYFAGLCRLMCAFANTEGGLIIFGIDDERREPSTRSTTPLPDMDRFEQATFQLVSGEFDLVHRRYDMHKESAVDILLVQRRNINHRPVRFKKAIHGYPEGLIWVRSRHEVREAQSTDIPRLYIDELDGVDELVVSAPLPPSPATVREFVGRMDCIDQIFAWLKQRDQPKQFLYGKGGSGKSTIAYEIARTLTDHKSRFRIEGEFPVDQIIYVTAKRSYLDLDSLKSDRFVQTDFSSESTLYLAILTLGNFNIDETRMEDIQYLKQSISEFFRQNSCIIIVDDIDTLTTSGLDIGMDYIDGVLWRSERRSKVLYTLRNKPSHSIANSIEVPGLPANEYREFIEACCGQFCVVPPLPEFRDNQLAKISERRPLVIESVIALRRNCSSYESAIDAFQQAAGDNVRKYVFEREWNALSPSGRAREILTIMALYDKPITFVDLCAVSRLSTTMVADSISQTQEMFLIVENDSSVSTYRLGDLTRLFVKQAAKSLDHYNRIEARVAAFKSSFFADSPMIDKLAHSLDRAVYQSRHGDPRSLQIFWHDLRYGEYQPKVKEDPRFRVLRGAAGLLLSIDNIDSSREDFETAFTMKSAPDLEYVRIWFGAEKMTDTSDVQTKKILDHVLRNKGYSVRDKAEFHARRGAFLYHYARENIEFEFDNNIARLGEALENHLTALSQYSSIPGYDIDKVWEYCRNTAFYLGLHLVRAGMMWTYVDILDNILKNDALKVDPLAEPTLSLFRSAAAKESSSRSDLSRLKNELKRVRDVMHESEKWFDGGERTYFINEYSNLLKMYVTMLRRKTLA